MMLHDYPPEWDEPDEDEEVDEDFDPPDDDDDYDPQWACERLTDYERRIA
jgi:hypothetical protein